jgi:hypothetical protein
MLDLDTIPRYSARNLTAWKNLDPGTPAGKTRWAVVVNIGKGIGESSVVEEFGVSERMDYTTQVMAQNRAAELNQASFILHVARRKVTRYITFSYVSLDLDECKRHAVIDGTHPDKIKITPDVSILHYAGNWMLWSDGKITTGIGISLPHAGILTPAARKLITTVREADAGAVNLPGGMFALTKLDAVLAENEVERGASRGVYAAERIEHMRVRWLDGTEGDLYAVTAGYFEGYRYDIFPTLEAAQAEFGYSPDASGISEFSSDDFDYDPRLGYVSKEQ